MDLHLTSLPDVTSADSIPMRPFATKEPISDFAPLIGAPTWTLEEGVNLLATFRTEERFRNGENGTAVFQESWDQIHKVLQKTLYSYELTEQTFLQYADDRSADETPKITYHSSTVYPDRFIEWAREVSLTVPDDFYEKLMRGQKRHISRRQMKEGGSLTDKERRELGALRREKEDLDMAIRATVRAVEYCIEVGREVKRDELSDLLTSGKTPMVTKAMFERIVPLIPSKYRKRAGAPSKCKIGDPDEQEI